MILKVIFGQRKEEYDGQYAPEALEVWDEYAVEGYTDGFDACVNEHLKKMMGKDAEFASIAVIDIKVNTDKIYNILMKTPKIEGKIVTT